MSDGLKSGVKRRGTLARLRHDNRGNTLAIMAASMMPLLGFAGCAIDAARLYAVKSRLQQACDAGVLAGRKAMTDASITNTTLDATATAQANSFFANNFRSGWYTTKTVSFVPTKTSNAQVAATATATVPMTILTMFGVTQKVINVQCRAEYNIADSDILFVLDTTGSMACLPSDSTSDCSNYVGGAGTITYNRPTDVAGGNTSMAGYPGTTAYYVPEKSGSRIAALRSAVLNFYDTMKTNTDSTTHIRYGFVTYTSTVNAGRAIVDMSPTYMVGGGGNSTTQAMYQTRVPNGENTSTDPSTTNNISQSTCNGKAFAKTYSSADTATAGTVNWTKNSSNSNGTCVLTTTTYQQKWTYKQALQTVSAYVTGVPVTDPTKLQGQTSKWWGCIEERKTSAGVSTFSTSSLPNDLNSSLIPTTDDDTRWRPMWPEITYARSGFRSTATINADGDTTSPRGSPSLGTEDYYTSGYVTCGKPVQRLREMTRANVSTYVNAPDFRAIGGTYHDTGMIWGTRMLDPTGIFASDTTAWPARAAPNRVIVFLTDGDMAPNTQIYGMYGTEYYDARVADGDTDNLQDYHNARFLAECAKAKSLKIDVWTVTIGTSATIQMQSCASVPTQALYTSNGNGLATTFATIAKQVAMLRITQ